MWETQVRSLGQEDPLEKEIAIHSRTIAWKIPWTEEPGRLPPMGSQRVRHDWTTLPLCHISLCSTNLFRFWCSIPLKWQEIQMVIFRTYFLPSPSPEVTFPGSYPTSLVSYLNNLHLSFSLLCLSVLSPLWHFGIQIYNHKNGMLTFSGHSDWYCVVPHMDFLFVFYLFLDFFFIWFSQLLSAGIVFILKI